MEDNRGVGDFTVCLEFWFGPDMARKWFEKNPDLDGEVRAALGALYEQAAAGALDHWRETPEGCLALVILLDQVPRNLFRGAARAFATDAAARAVACHAVEMGLDRALSQVQRMFLYLPFEHSESLEDQKTCLRLMGTLDENPEWLKYSASHHDIIARFGRFPHRNDALGRDSTPEERAFLDQPGSSF